jgi:hypothetical protein
VFRVLLGAFVFFAAMAAFAFAGMTTRSLAVALGLAPAAALVTDHLVHRGRRAQGGIEEGLSAAALVLLLFAAGWIAVEALRIRDHTLLQLLLAVTGLLCLAAVWRWGMSAYGVVGAVSLYGLLSQWHGSRLLWTVVPLVTAVPLYRGWRSMRLRPSARSACGGALMVGLAALYAATNHALAQHGVLEGLSLRGSSAPSAWFGPLTGAATALLPLATLAVALWRRERALMVAGALMLVASVATLRYYVHAVPIWLLLTASGAVLVAGALALRRWLDAAADRERSGFTAQPVCGESGGQRVLELAASLAALTPQARALPSPEPGPGVEPGGGSFGGAGASETF